MTTSDDDEARRILDEWERAFPLCGEAWLNEDKIVAAYARRLEAENVALRSRLDAGDRVNREALGMVAERDARIAAARTHLYVALMAPMEAALAALDGEAGA